MSCRIGLVALLACVVAVAAARGQDKPAAPEKNRPPGKSKRDERPPAPRPDAAKAAAADEAALREALKGLATALQEGKADGIKRVIHAANPTERKMVDAMAAMAVQIAGLYKVSVKAFGEEEAKSLTGDVTAEMSRIDHAEVAIDGDTATVRYRDPDAPPPPPTAPAEGDPAPGGETAPAPPPPAEAAQMVLKRVDGRWQIPMSELSKDATPEGIEQRLEDLEVQTRVISDLAKEIADGKYGSAAEAAEAWHARMMQALTPGKPAADGPAKERDKGTRGDGEASRDQQQSPDVERKRAPRSGAE